MAFWRPLRRELCEYLTEIALFFYTFFDNWSPRFLQSIANGFRERFLPPADARIFTAYIYKGELERIKTWVIQRDKIETGGDLFGLWVDRHNVVIQFVLGPGKKCRRTTTSFYQDIDYLANVGGYITRNQGLCNIGQWHSHHRLQLPQPSTGDEDTVWNNMPGLAMERYVVFIATIIGVNTVNVNCFLFEIENEKKLPVLKGEICVLDEDGSPVRMCRELTALVESGEESKKNHDDCVIDTK